jgi:hypothetical protein
MVKFSEDLCQCLIEFYSNGTPLKYCADAVGVRRETVYLWMNKGKKAKSGKYHEFYLEMQKARAKNINKNFQDIQKNNSWMAKQYALQCMDPDEFVVAEKQKIESETKQTIEANVDMNDPRIQEQDLAMLKELIGDKDARNRRGDKSVTK